MSKKLKIGILGTRGIPNQYGGFEQFAEYLSLGLVERGHEVVVYNGHTHTYQQSSWNGVQLVHCYDPEYKIGTAGQFIYDLNCILDARKRNFDILLQLGYTSSSVWSFLLPKNQQILTNMDGLEWKRSKYSSKVQRFLKWAEKRAVNSSDVLIADSIGIQSYLKKTFSTDSVYIPYGAHTFTNPSQEVLSTYNLPAGGYDMLIARMEPENNIEVILDGVEASNSQLPMLVIGGIKNNFGQYLQTKFTSSTKIKFLGPVYDQNALNNLRYFSRYYFHGHSVGGTNPSLLEAMASNTCIIAHHNEFNEAILGKDAYYFTNASNIKNRLEQELDAEKCRQNRQVNQKKIEQKFTWNSIVSQYEELFLSSVK